MKTIRYIALLLCIVFSSGAVAQRKDMARPRPGERMEKLESMKIGFLTKRLDLSPAEAKAFWPVYNAYQDDMEKLRKGHRESLLDAKRNIDNLSDQDVEKLVDNEIIYKQNELDVIKKYHSQFKQVISPRKVAKLYRAEEDWKRKILDMWRERHAGRMPGE